MFYSALEILRLKNL